jgi:hypothetical protein
MLTAIIGAVIGAVLGSYLTKRWTPDPTKEIGLLRARLDTFEKERTFRNKDDEFWMAKFENAASQVVKVGLSEMIRSPEGNSTMPLYGLIFPDIGTKTRIETFLVERDSRSIRFFLRTPSVEQMRGPIIRQVVDETLACIDSFKEKYPDLAAKYL